MVHAKAASALLVTALLVTRSAAFIAGSGIVRQRAQGPLDEDEMSDFVSTNDTRLKWIHIEKTGTSFANVMLTYSCKHITDAIWAESSIVHGTSFDRLYNSCNDTWTMCDKFLHAHFPVGVNVCSSPSSSQGKELVSMFRQPEQRLISDWYYMSARYALGKDANPFFKPSETALEYAQRFQACQVKTLMGETCGRRQLSDSLMTIGVKVGKMRLAHQFAFIGLTEHWATSVCLFHSMLGGSCHSREFLHDNKGQNSSSGLYDAGYHLGNWTDQYDRLIYRRVLREFWFNVEAYNVSMDNCRVDICADASEAFLNDTTPMEFDIEYPWMPDPDEDGEDASVLEAEEDTDAAFERALEALAAAAAADPAMRDDDGVDSGECAI
eukprot:NODE_11158_length_1304_cov_2.140187.p1 GENE.NODE_11158_length_1304_cov_2.140187~~NODE_11158_length_1304_cov_2.140187.p1  ORF type:complete len:381 (-),score=107.69 NODE_11158_length_1304_cov_2.140187:60-1202(-)